RDGGRDALAPLPLGLGAPWQLGRDPARRERATEPDPAVFRPLLGLARGRMQQDAEGRATGTGEPGSVEAEVDRTLGRIAEREAGEDPVALDRMELAGDAVAHVVEAGRQRLANAGCVVTMPAAARDPADQRGAQQALGVDHLVVDARAYHPPEGIRFAPGPGA